MPRRCPGRDGGPIVSPEIAILLDPYNAVYVEVPKVACSSIKLAIAAVLGVDLARAGGDPHRADFPTASISEGPGGPLFPGRFAFAFVRNPWDRLVSCYRDKILGESPDFTNFTIRPGVADCLAGYEQFSANMSFDAFVEAVTGISDADADPHFRSQYTFLTNGAGDVAVDFIGRFERLREEFERVANRIGLPGISLPHVQAATGPVVYEDYYTPATREWVARRFRTDIELFDYRFGGERAA